MPCKTACKAWKSCRGACTVSACRVHGQALTAACDLSQTRRTFNTRYPDTSTRRPTSLQATTHSSATSSHFQELRSLSIVRSFSVPERGLTRSGSNTTCVTFRVNAAEYLQQAQDLSWYLAKGRYRFKVHAHLPPAASTQRSTWSFIFLANPDVVMTSPLAHCAWSMAIYVLAESRQCKGGCGTTSQSTSICFIMSTCTIIWLHADLDTDHITWSDSLIDHGNYTRPPAGMMSEGAEHQNAHTAVFANSLFFPAPTHKQLLISLLPRSQVQVSTADPKPHQGCPLHPAAASHDSNPCLHACVLGCCALLTHSLTLASSLTLPPSLTLPHLGARFRSLSTSPTR